MAPGPAAVLHLQRAAGNRATTRAVQRVAVTSGGTLTGFSFTVGSEVSPKLARAAKKAAQDGAVSTTELSALLTAALAVDETVNDHEQLFMAGLLDPVNASALHAASYAAAGDTITFAASTVTSARRAQVEAVDRPVVPAKVAAGLRSAQVAMLGFDLVGMAAHLSATEKAALAAVVRMTPGFGATVRSALKLAGANGLTATVLLHGMINAASDGTPGDLALAAAVLAVAQAEAHPLFADLTAGRVHVDQVPASAMPGGATHYADYATIAPDAGFKGDTIYLPTGLDISNAYQRSVVIHELRHAIDDQAAGGGKVQFADQARLELAAYRAQGASILSQLSAASGTTRTTVAKQIGAEWGDLVLLGMVLQSRGDRAVADPLITLVNTNAPSARKVAPVLLAQVLGLTVAQLEARLIPRIVATYGMAAGATMPVDGLAGESIVDWISRT